MFASRGPARRGGYHRRRVRFGASAPGFACRGSIRRFRERNRRSDGEINGSCRDSDAPGLKSVRPRAKSACLVPIQAHSAQDRGIRQRNRRIRDGIAASSRDSEARVVPSVAQKRGRCSRVEVVGMRRRGARASAAAGHARAATKMGGARTAAAGSGAAGVDAGASAPQGREGTAGAGGVAAAGAATAAGGGTNMMTVGNRAG